MSDLQQQEIEEEMNTGLNISASHMNGITQDRCVSLAISVCQPGRFVWVPLEAEMKTLRQGVNIKGFI